MNVVVSNQAVLEKNSPLLLTSLFFFFFPSFFICSLHFFPQEMLLVPDLLGDRRRARQGSQRRDRWKRGWEKTQVQMPLNPEK